MISELSEQLSKQSLEDVNHPLVIPYQTRSKTRAQQLRLDHDLCTGSRTIFDAPPSVTVNDISPEERPRSRSHTAGSAACCFRRSDVADSRDGGRVLSATPPSAPPKKRHCRSMSAGEVTERSRASSRFKPRATKHWRPVHTRSKLDGYQGHSPLSKTACFNYHRLSSHIPSSQNAGATSSNISEYSTPPDSPVPRPVSATSWDGSTNPPFWLERFNSFRPVSLPRTMYAFSSVDDRDRMSESSGSVTSVSSSRSDTLHDMELRNQKVVQRCKSQPCVPVSRHGGGGKKRRRNEEARPKLDFYKMAEARLNKPAEIARRNEKVDGILPRTRITRSQALMCKKSGLRSAVGKRSPEECIWLQTIASSPGESNNNLIKESLRPISPESESNGSSSVMITPTCSPTRDVAAKDGPSGSRHRNISKDDGYHGDSDCNLDNEDEEDDMFQCADLDLDEIEKH